MSVLQTLLTFLALLAVASSQLSATEDLHPPIAAGGYHCMAIDADGSLWAWGRNYAGQLGDGTTNDSHVPIRIGEAPDWVAVSAGDHHSVAMKQDGTLWAWGLNNYGQLGNGDTSDLGVRILKGDAHVGVYGEQFRNGSKMPVQVAGGNDWVAACGQGHHSIGMKRDGSVWTWGLNWFGQLGIGSTENQVVPVRVALEAK